MAIAKKVILDAGAILNNPEFLFSRNQEYFMTSQVLEELKDLRSRMLADNALKNNCLVLSDPSEKALLEAASRAKALNTRLSPQDIGVIALAMDFRERKEDFSVITDDYSVQNVLSSAGINFSGSLHGTIKKHFKMKRKCSNCGAELKGEECQVCGQ